MRSFLIKRILQAVSVVVCISALTFFVLNIVPGDPVRVMMGDMADEATVQQVRHTMGLDKPIPEQYANWFVKMLGGDFGTSYTQKRPVIALLTKAWEFTLRLAVFAYLFAIVFGLFDGYSRRSKPWKMALIEHLCLLQSLVFLLHRFGWHLYCRLFLL